MFTNSEQTFEEDSSRIGLVTNVGFRNNLEQHVHYRAKKSVHSFVQTYKALEKYHPPYERQSSGDTKKKNKRRRNRCHEAPARPHRHKRKARSDENVHPSHKPRFTRKKKKKLNLSRGTRFLPRSIQQNLHQCAPV